MKKRNKAYQPKRVSIPMLFMTQTVLDQYPHLATSLYGQIIAFIERPCVESSNNLSHQLACIAGGMSHMNSGAPIKGRRDAGSLAICSAVSCMEGIGNRFERIGVIEVSATEAATLKAAAGRLDQVLQGMPLACYIRAEAECHIWLKESTREAA
jgi:hypothetical protein